MYIANEEYQAIVKFFLHSYAINYFEACLSKFQAWMLCLVVWLYVGGMVVCVFLLSVLLCFAVIVMSSAEVMSLCVFGRIRYV